jgi:hypothetical protein
MMASTSKLLIAAICEAITGSSNSCPIITSS